MAQKQEPKQKILSPGRPSIYAWLFCVIGISMLFCAAFLPDVGPVPFCRALGIFLFRSMWMVKLAFIIVAALHVIEAVYGWYLAKRVDPHNAIGWFWEIFVLGFFSLRFLLKKVHKST